jgi:hypothetical protein
MDSDIMTGWQVGLIGGKAMSKAKLVWKVVVVKVDKLQDTLNDFEQNDYEIERFERHAETYEGVDWVVVGWKPSDM